MIVIFQEIERIKSSELTITDKPLVNTAHAQEDLIENNWTDQYKHELTGFPVQNKDAKYWPAYNRVDNAFNVKSEPIWFAFVF